MHELESPLDIYTHDLLGMKNSSWHRVDQPKEELPEPTPLSSKQKYITILLCVGFLYFVAVGVWTIQQKVFPPNMAEANTQLFLPIPIEQINQTEQEFLEISSAAEWGSTPWEGISYFNYVPIEAWSPRVTISKIDRIKARRLAEGKKSLQIISPPPSWKPLIHINVEPVMAQQFCFYQTTFYTW